MVTGRIFNIQRFCLHDGPGIRTTVFLKGCPLRCRWCSNPESQLIEKELSYNDNKCIQCLQCIDKCPNKCLRFEDGLRIDRKLCKSCFEICSNACKTGALEIVGRGYSVEEVIDEIKKDEIFYKFSKGGVTFSGGEPLMQLNFLHEILKESKKKNYHTAIETCGFCETEKFELIQGFVDLFLYDIKIMNTKKHIEWTGQSNDKILNNLRYLHKKGASIIVRVPVIPGFNDNKRDIQQISIFLEELGIQRMQLLPYHRLGLKKYQNTGRGYELGDIFPPRQEKMQELKRIAELHVEKVQIGG